MNDLDLAIELVNTVYALASPPDRLTEVEHFRGILRAGGQDAAAAELRDSDLARLVDLRERLRTVFGAEPAAAVAAVNALLRDLGAVPELAAGESGIELCWGAGQDGFSALAARMAGALAIQLTTAGPRRLGVCAATPCTCVFVDRTRPGSRKYCCDTCNDRVAAAAHYRRTRRTKD